MSVLSLPRIYFQGTSFWNPTTVNNYEHLYNAATNEVQPYPIEYNGEIIANDEELKRHIREINWSVYGESGCGFVTQENREKNGTPNVPYIINTRITGGTLDNGTYIDNDPLCGREIQILGNKFNDNPTAARLVDSNPYGALSSQIFFEKLNIGDDNTGILGSKDRRTYSYWVLVKRNLDPLLNFAAGQSGGVFQVAIPFEQLEINNGESSQLIEQLRVAMQESDARGLMMRFSSQTTLYFVNVNPETPYANIPDGPQYATENQAALTERFLNGEVFMNPAYSYTVGSIGVWKDGELASTPGGRYLMPGEKIAIEAPDNQVKSVELGPLLAELDESRSTLSLDALSTITAYNKEGEIADLGNLTIKAGETEIATLDYSQYNQAAYNKTAGIIDITDLTSTQISAVRSQPLQLWIDRTNSNKGLGAYLWSLVQEAVKGVQRTAVPLEEKMTALSDDRSIYIEEGESATCTVRVRDRDGIPPTGTRLLVAQYKYNSWTYLAPDNPSRPIDISGSIFELDEQGSVSIDLTPVNPGICYILFLPFSGEPPSPPLINLNSVYSFFSIIRVMPFDNNLDAKPDSELTWEFMYEDVFRVYDLLYPIMSEIIPMNNRKLMEGAWMQIKAVLGDPNIYHEDDPMWHSTMYMSITRDLSKGKRKLLDRWCDLVSRGNQP